MTTNATASTGAIFKRAAVVSSQGDNYAAISEINAITGPDKTRTMINVTSIDSTGGYMEYIPSFREPGTYTLEANWTRDGFDDMNDDFESDSLWYYQIVMPDTGATTYTFAGYVQSLGRAVPFNDKIQMSVTIQVSGQETMTS